MLRKQRPVRCKTEGQVDGKQAQRSVIPFLLLLLVACSGSGEGEDEDECLRTSSTLSLLLDSNSRASCSFLLAFFSFLRRFWIEAE